MSQERNIRTIIRRIDQALPEQRVLETAERRVRAVEALFVLRGVNVHDETVRIVFDEIAALLRTHIRLQQTVDALAALAGALSWIADGEPESADG